MPQAHKTSFLITLALLFLLPIFFVPGGALSLDVAKSALLALGVIMAVLVFSLETWQEGKLNFPWHPFILVAGLLPLIYLLSALSSTPSALSLFGYNFEVGTFGYILFGSALLVLMGIIFTDTSRVLQALVIFFASISVIAIFVAIKVISGGDFLVWGNFFGNMGNPIGNWTDLAVSFGLLTVLAALALGMIPMKLSARVLVYGAFALGVVLLVVINFSTAFILTLGASIILFFYFSKIEKHFFTTAPTLVQGSGRFALKSTFLPIILGIISIIFLINPTISETRGKLGTVIANTFKIENASVRPSLSTTLSISKAVLSQVTFLGSGPNTFGHDWLIYKPIDVNTTPFWAVAFPFGIGFIPTQIASTGVLGTLLWLAFFVLLVILGAKILSHIPESRAERFTLISVFLATLFLWIASFLYVPSGVLLMLAFIFSGLLVATSREAGIISLRTTILKESRQTYFTSILVLVAVALGAVLFGWVGFEKTASAFYFKRAVDLSNTNEASLEAIESKLNRAIKFAPADIHYVAISRINFVKAQTAANDTTRTPAENQAIFEEAVRRSIEAARLAVGANPAGYQNWTSLGVIYSALVPPPLSVEGAYENAKFAYGEAFKKNPANPELPLLVARLELNKGNVEEARSFIRNSIALKEDYADAYLMLSQLEVEQGNSALAISSAERLALLVPNNSGIYFELGVLKYSTKDYIGAVEAFRAALATTPDYANAKYYLGLSLAQIGKLDEARGQFEELLITNPDSKEVQLILLELKAGRKPSLDQ